MRQFPPAKDSINNKGTMAITVSILIWKRGFLCDPTTRQKKNEKLHVINNCWKGEKLAASRDKSLIHCPVQSDHP